MVRFTLAWLIPNSAARARSVRFVRNATNTSRTRNGSGRPHGLPGRRRFG